jgi:hypothetical protein
MSGSTAKACQISRSRPADRISSRTMASARWRIGHLVGGDLADDAHAQPGAGERLAPHDLVGQAQLGAHLADLVLEEQAQGLDQVELHVLGEAAHVVVALDLGGAGGARLDDVGVERALHQERASSMPPDTSSKMRMNSSPMALRLSSGSVIPARRSK